jgi:hypothetical protein
VETGQKCKTLEIPFLHDGQGIRWNNAFSLSKSHRIYFILQFNGEKIYFEKFNFSI